MSEVNQIGYLASGILKYDFSYIDSPTEQEAELLTISGSISGRLGELNVLIHQSFGYTGADGNPCPRLGLEEAAILKQIYIRDYNLKQSQKALRGDIGTTSEGGSEGSSSTEASDWIELREGDTVIKRSTASLTNSATNQATKSKQFNQLSDDAKTKISELVNAYNMYGAAPRQVAGFEAADLWFEAKEECPVKFPGK